jgi:hypothetical protein
LLRFEFFFCDCDLGPDLTVQFLVASTKRQRELIRYSTRSSGLRKTKGSTLEWRHEGGGHPIFAY